MKTWLNTFKLNLNCTFNIQRGFSLQSQRIFLFEPPECLLLLKLKLHISNALSRLGATAALEKAFVGENKLSSGNVVHIFHTMPQVRCMRDRDERLQTKPFFLSGAARCSDLLTRCLEMRVGKCLSALTCTWGEASSSCPLSFHTSLVFLHKHPQLKIEVWFLHKILVNKTFSFRKTLTLQSTKRKMGFKNPKQDTMVEYLHSRSRKQQNKMHLLA